MSDATTLTQRALAAVRQLKKRVAALEKKVRLLEGDLAAGEEAAGHERMGELLKSRIRDVKPGMSAITVPDFETGDPVEVTLDPEIASPDPPTKPTS